jgi:hypothetical protein
MTFPKPIKSRHITVAVDEIIDRRESR